ncbi:MAG: ABC transporter permease [Actinobacteria bacterium]|nr:ABC transporter permease [Actinomycetota bacterium]
MRVSFIARELRTGLRRNFTMTLALVISVAVSLALFGSALLMKSQVERMKGYWYDKVQVSIYLCGENSTAVTCQGPVTEEQRTEVQATLESLQPIVQSLYYESSAEAFARFKIQFKGSPIVSSVSEDALPESFRVKLDDPANFDTVSIALAGKLGVESIVDQRKLLQKFFQILRGLQSFALIVAIAMLLVTVLLVMNTVRIAAFARRRETTIMRSVGASNMSIRLPFIAEAIFAAIVGATLAAGLLMAVKKYVIDDRLAPNISYVPFVTWQEVLGILPWLFGAGIGITVLASTVTLRRYLRG